MIRKRRIRLLIGLTSLIVGAYAAWIFWPIQLAPAEAAIVGQWFTPRQSDGSYTVVLLSSDRNCRIRWLDQADKEETERPPQNGRWSIEGETLSVNTRHVAVSFAGGFDVKLAGEVWTFAVEGDRLVHGPSRAILQRSIVASAPKP